MVDHLGELAAAGVAIWLDRLSRTRLISGSLADLVRDCHVVGVSTNPTIFQRAMNHGDCHDGSPAGAFGAGPHPWRWACCCSARKRQ